MGSRSEGFTYIEMLITVALVAICFVPLMALFSTAVTNASAAEELVVGVNLVREEMEKLKNLNYTEERLAQIGDVTYPGPDDEPLLLAGMEWKVERKVKERSDPLEVEIRAYKIDRGKAELIAELVTLVEDLQ